MARTKHQLSFDSAWATISSWRSKEMQLQEVSRLFDRREISNITRIRLNHKIVNDGKADERNVGAEGLAGDEQ